MISFKGAALPLTQSGLSNACSRLGVGAAEIWALVFTETDPPYGGFMADTRPQILYEQHIFHRLTGGQFAASNPDISSSHAGNYGAAGAHQYDRLSAAAALNETAALQSASWGIGQTLGEGYKMCGFASPQDMVARLIHSEDEQLLAVVQEILATHNASSLASHDWRNFARIYNGPAYARNQYDAHLASWFAKFAGGGLPDLRIRTAQIYLMYLGFEPSLIDGLWGTRSRSAMNQFQTKAGISQTDDLDDNTYEKIIAAGQLLTTGASSS
ncbi:MAG TPA: N-acetylmuramidase domain-containing protein [Candidatus Binataceae bacterium]|nr:N-acetylmuramidase domain-containing protein [Candidatus Binataceae bacterium]